MKNLVLGSTMMLAVAWLVPFISAGHGTINAQVVSPLTPERPKETDYGGCPTENLAFHRCALEKAKMFNPSRTPDGTPDLQGYWRGRETNSNRSVERVTADNPLTRDALEPWSLSEGTLVDPPDRMLPYQPWAAKIGRLGENYHRYIDPRTSCGSSSVPRSLFDRTQILQPPGESFVTLLYEDQMNYHIVPMDGRPHIGSNIKLTNGDSVGRWEGNSLVIDVTNLNGYTFLDDSGNFYTDAARITERLTMIDSNTIHLQATIDDPKAYTRPWTMVVPLVRDTTAGFEFLEEACREGERVVPTLRESGLRFYRGDNMPWARPH